MWKNTFQIWFLSITFEVLLSKMNNSESSYNLCACVCVLPDGSFGYRAIHQGAQASVQTPHPMAVHRLLHTVTCKQMEKVQQLSREYEKTAALAPRGGFSVFPLSTVRFVCRGPFARAAALAGKHRRCQSSQTLGEN